MQDSQVTEIARFRPLRWRESGWLILILINLINICLQAMHAWDHVIQGNMDGERLLSVILALLAIVGCAMFTAVLVNDFRYRAQRDSAIWIENGYLFWRCWGVQKMALTDIRDYKFLQEKSRLSGLTLYPVSGKSVFISFYGITVTQELVTQLRANSSRAGSTSATQAQTA